MEKSFKYLLELRDLHHLELDLCPSVIRLIGHARGHRGEDLKVGIVVWEDQQIDVEKAVKDFLNHKPSILSLVIAQVME